jgi:hypothetical protein
MKLIFCEYQFTGWKKRLASDVAADMRCRNPRRLFLYRKKRLDWKKKTKSKYYGSVLPLLGSLVRSGEEEAANAVRSRMMQCIAFGPRFLRGQISAFGV